MRITVALIAAAAVCTVLPGCATTGTVGSAEVIRYHLGQPLERGAIVVQPAGGGDGLAEQPFAEAVSRGLATVGYAPAPPGGDVQFIAIVDVRRRWSDGPARSGSGLSIGLGGGGFSGGRHSGVGLGLGGGISFPIGRERRGPETTELSVTIKRRVDQSPVWEGQARTVAGASVPKEAVAEKLARALFTGFPGESGRTIEVR